jgi:heat shock protein HslJ
MRTSLAGLLLLAACSTGSGGTGGAAGGDPSAAVAAAPLTDTRWHLVRIGADSAIRRGTERDPYLRFTDADKRVGGSTTCNSMGGTYEVTGDRISFGPLMSTKMACVEPELMAQETRFMSALDSVERFAISADTLSLHAAGAADPVLRFTAAR